jgi:phosphoglycolate phosphatase-like HAD superfamily hydrolase
MPAPAATSVSWTPSAGASPVTSGKCIAVGDSIEDLESAQYAGRFFCVANGPERDRALREALPRYPNATVTEARMGDGVYEAVVATLAGAPGAS